MNLVLVESNFGKPISGGFRHTVFEVTPDTFKQIRSIVFNTLLDTEGMLNQYRRDPVKFLEALGYEESSSDSSDISIGSSEYD